MKARIGERGNMNNDWFIAVEGYPGGVIGYNLSQEETLRRVQVSAGLAWAFRWPLVGDYPIGNRGEE
jgi:hypothetical protein